jgi:hypothetical protein
MPQLVFDSCAITVLHLHRLSGEPMEKFAREFGDAYRLHYQDDNFEADFLVAAQTVRDLFKSQIPDLMLAGFCVQMLVCIKSFTPQGTRRKWKLFSGALFDKERQPNPNRVKDFQRSMIIYHTGTISGALPVAPNGWSA